MSSAAVHLILQSIDAIVTCDGRSLPPGTVAALARGIDATKRGGLSPAEVRAAEMLAVEAHRVAALRLRGETASADRIGRTLSADCWRWLRTLPLGCA